MGRTAWCAPFSPSFPGTGRAYPHADVMIPPPSTAPVSSYTTADWPGVTARWGSWNSSRTRPSAGKTVAGCSRWL